MTTATATARENALATDQAGAHQRSGADHGRRPSALRDQDGRQDDQVSAREGRTQGQGRQEGRADRTRAAPRSGRAHDQDGR